MAVEVETRSRLKKYLPYPELTSLGLRDYRLWWVSSSSSMLTQFGMQIVLAWWVQRELQSPALVGTIILAFGMPSFLFLLPAGILADKWDRRRQLIITQVVAFAAALLLAILFTLDVVTFPIGLTFAFISGSTVAFSQPARQALIPMMVPRRLLSNGIVLGSLSMNSSRIVAPAVAGILMASVGLDAALFFISGFLAVGLVAALRMRIPHFEEDAEFQQAGGAPQTAGAGAAGQSMAGGFRFLLQNQPLMVLMGLYMAGGLFVVGPMQAMVPVLIDEVWGLDARAVGYAFSAQAIAGFVAGLYLTRIGGLRNKGGFFALSMVCGTSSFAFFSLSPWFGLALVFFVGLGAASSMFANMSQSIIQAHTPRELMGRVMSIYQVSISGLLPLGAFFAGLSAEVIGAPLTGFLGGITAATMAAFALVFATRFRRIS